VSIFEHIIRYNNQTGNVNYLFHSTGHSNVFAYPGDWLAFGKSTLRGCHYVPGRAVISGNSIGVQ